MPTATRTPTRSPSTSTISRAGGGPGGLDGPPPASASVPAPRRLERDAACRGGRPARRHANRDLYAVEPLQERAARAVELHAQLHRLPGRDRPRGARTDQDRPVPARAEADHLAVLEPC